MKNKSLIDDKSDALSLVKIDGNNILNLCEKLRGDLDIILAVANQSREALKYMSESAKSDKNIIREIIKLDSCNAKFASSLLKNDKDFVMECVALNGHILGIVSKNLQNDIDVVTVAVSQCGNALEYASYKLKDNKDIVLLAVKKYGWALSYCTQRLREDNDIVREAISQDGMCFLLLPTKLKTKDNLLKAMEQNAFAIKYAKESSVCLSDRSIWDLAINKNPYVLMMAPDNLQNDKLFLEKLEVELKAENSEQEEIWFTERMEVLKNYREKEKMEKEIQLNNKKSKKMKF